MNFNRWLRRFSSSLEKFLFYATLGFLGLMVVVQAVMVKTDIGYYLNSVHRLEGEPYELDKEKHSKQEDFSGVLKDLDYSRYTGEEIYEVTLKVIPEVDNLKVIINEQERKVIEGKTVTVEVSAGDLIEIYGEANKEVPVTVRVASSPGLVSPEEGKEVLAFGDYEMVGWVVPQNN